MAGRLCRVSGNRLRRCVTGTVSTKEGRAEGVGGGLEGWKKVRGRGERERKGFGVGGVKKSVREESRGWEEEINEEQRCRVDACEGLVERDRGRGIERRGKRTGPTGACEETSQALIGNLVDCQLQTNRKSGASETRSRTIPAGKARPPTAANLGIFRQCASCMPINAPPGQSIIPHSTR